MVVTNKHTDLLCDVRHKRSVQQYLLLLFVIRERLQQLLVIKIHVLLANVHTCLLDVLSSDIFKRSDEGFEKLVVLCQVILREFDSFALDELLVHFLDLVHMSNFEIVEIPQVLFDFLSPIDQLKVDDC